MRLLSLLEDGKEDEVQKEKQRKLYEAARNGTFTSLVPLIQEDPLILGSSVSSTSDTPLHVAVLLGHFEFAKDLLGRKPELSKALNSNGSSPLHLASAKGYVEIVKELVLVNSEICFVLDHDGRSPLHLASIKGRVPVLTELIRAAPEAARVLTGGGETCLHLCAKYNRLDALKVLLGSLKKDDQFVNWKDQDGNTVLHLAVAKKQIEIINYLLGNTETELNARNAKGLTPLDVLLQGPRDLRDMEIKQCLQKGKPSRINHIPSLAYSADMAKSTSNNQQQDSKDVTTSKRPKKKHVDWLGRKRSALMIVASLLATVAFQAGLSPPGGVWQDDYTANSNSTIVYDRSHEAGQSVMAFNMPTGYGQYIIFNTIAFLASLSIILLQVSGLPLKRRRWMWTQMVTMWIAISAHTITYFITLIHMTPKHVEGTLFHLTRISVLTWLAMMGTVVIGNFVRVVLHLLRKYGYIEEKDREPLINFEQEEDEEL